jgi:hypothetical protein
MGATTHHPGRLLSVATTGTPPHEALSALVAGGPVRVADDSAAEALPALAEFHGLSPLLERAARDGRASLPQPVLDRITQNATRSRRLRAVLDLELHLVTSGAPTHMAIPILLKGPAVARWYPDPSLRPYTDIDLLVPEADLDAWGDALTRLGFAGPGADEAAHARLTHHHLVFHRGGIVVELHWRLFAAREARGLDYAALAAQAAIDPTLAGLLVTSLPAQLVVLGVHLAHHYPDTRKLMWLMDFVTLGDPEAVEAARALADGWDVRWALEAALADAENLLGESRWSATPGAVGGLAGARRSGAGLWRTRLAKARAIGLRKMGRHGLERFRTRRRSDGSG